MANTVFTTAAREQDVTRAIVRDWTATFEQCLMSDVIVAGAGPSGLACARDLASDGLRVVVIEGNNYLGGGFWIGGYLMNPVTIREPAQDLLAELGVPIRRSGQDGLWVADGPHACSKLIAGACDAGVRFLNMTVVEDVVLRGSGRVEGVVVNWTPVRHLPRAITCVDPVALETRLVVDATGHEAHVVHALAHRGLIELPGCGPMDVVSSEEAVVDRSGQVFPGLVVIGMAVASVFKLPRMGPTFGSMLLSGRRGARLIRQLLREPAQPERCRQGLAPVTVGA